MACEHDLAEQETACADGLCPICLSYRLNDLTNLARKMADVWNGRNTDNARAGDAFAAFRVWDKAKK